MTFMTEVDPVVTEGSLLADETSKEEQLKAAAERINNAELTEGELDESMAPEHYEASDLRVLEGLEAVRIRPGMYIGSTGPRGLHHLVYEIVDNSVDEALAGYASHIEVTILPDNGIRVVDDGRGIPVDEVPGEGVSGVETVMTKLHAGGKFGGDGYSIRRSARRGYLRGQRTLHPRGHRSAPSRASTGPRRTSTSTPPRP